MAVAPVHSNPSRAALATMATDRGRMAALPKDQQVKAAAGQFEAILLRQFLQESVNGMMGGDSGGASGSVYGYLLTDTLADKLSAGGGLGLARMLERQLSPAAHPPAAQSKPSTP